MHCTCFYQHFRIIIISSSWINIFSLIKYSFSQTITIKQASKQAMTVWEKKRVWKRDESPFKMELNMWVRNILCFNILYVYVQNFHYIQRKHTSLEMTLNFLRHKRLYNEQINHASISQQKHQNIVHILYTL